MRIEVIDGAVDVTGLFRSLKIAKVEQWPGGRWSVVLVDGRIGIGLDLGEAFEAANRPDAANVRRVAA